MFLVRLYEWYIQQIDDVLRQFENVVQNVKEQAVKAGKEGHKIVGYFIASVVHNVSAIVNMAISDPELQFEDGVKIRDYAVSRIREFVEKHFGKLGMLLLDTFRRKMHERKSEVAKALEAELIE